MPKEWFIRKNGKTYGPISTAKLKATSQSGKLTTEDKVSNSKDGPWHPVTKIKGLTPKTKGAEKQRQRSSRPKTRKTKPAVESPPPPNPTPPVAAPYVPPQSAAPPPLVNHLVPQPNPGADTRALLQYQAHSKSAGLAYAFWFFLGMWGAHRFYCGKTGSGVAMLVITLISIPLCFVIIGIFGILGVALWALVDALLISGWIRGYNARLAHMVDP